MTVYVDKEQIPYRGMLMCHMLADSTDELLRMADTIGVQRRWIQKRGTYREHFDICLSKRALALKAGAVEIERAQLSALLRARREAAEA